jgi:signal transduction histidine kinase
MNTINSYFLKRFLIISSVGYFLFTLLVLISSYSSTKNIIKQKEILLHQNFTQKKDKILLFYTLNDQSSLQEEIKEISQNNPDHEICFSTNSRKKCTFNEYYQHPSEPDIKIYYKLNDHLFYLILFKNVFSLSNILLLFLLTILGVVSLQIINLKIIKPIILLNKYLNNFMSEQKNNNHFHANSNLLEWIHVENNLKALIEKIYILEKELIQDTMLTVSKQVAHDIRSPLAALNMITGQLKDIPEQQRFILRSSVNRINDIANTLLTKSKNQPTPKIFSASDNTSDSNDELLLKVELIPALAETLISEKRVQFRDKLDLEIESDLNSSYGAFAKINSIEMARVLSNLINNSAEALPKYKGRIVLSVRKSSNSVIIEVADNGIGIPQPILEKLGELGFTHGKSGPHSGFGLGIYHAKKVIEASGGQFQVASKKGSGTTVTITLPAALNPRWFIDKIAITPGTQVISVDDDLSIHNLWEDRIQSLNHQNLVIHHLALSSYTELLNFHNESMNSETTRLYLIDYEFLGQHKNGLQMIEELKIGQQAILVTSRYEEIEIRNKCEKLGVKLLPKGMASYVPMEIIFPREPNTPLNGT